MSRPILGGSFAAPDGAMGIVQAVRESADGIFVRIGSAYAEWQHSGVYADAGEATAAEAAGEAPPAAPEATVEASAEAAAPEGSAEPPVGAFKPFGAPAS